MYQGNYSGHNSNSHSQPRQPVPYPPPNSHSQLRQPVPYAPPNSIPFPIQSTPVVIPGQNYQHALSQPVSSALSRNVPTMSHQQYATSNHQLPVGAAPGHYNQNQTFSHPPPASSTFTSPPPVGNTFTSPSPAHMMPPPFGPTAGAVNYQARSPPSHRHALHTNDRNQYGIGETTHRFRAPTSECIRFKTSGENPLYPAANPSYPAANPSYPAANLSYPAAINVAQPSYNNSGQSHFGSGPHLMPPPAVPVSSQRWPSTSSSSTSFTPLGTTGSPSAQSQPVRYNPGTEKKQHGAGKRMQGDKRALLNLIEEEELTEWEKQRRADEKFVKDLLERADLSLSSKITSTEEKQAPNTSESLHRATESLDFLKSALAAINSSEQPGAPWSGDTEKEQIESKEQPGQPEEPDTEEYEEGELLPTATEIRNTLASKRIGSGHPVSNGNTVTAPSVSHNLDVDCATKMGTHCSSDHSPALSHGLQGAQPRDETEDKVTRKEVKLSTVLERFGIHGSLTDIKVVIERSIQEKVEKNRKRRDRFKRLRRQTYMERNLAMEARKKDEEAMDLWQKAVAKEAEEKKMAEQIKVIADETLEEVRRKDTEILKAIQTVHALKKLRAVRKSKLRDTHRTVLDPAVEMIESGNIDETFDTKCVSLLDMLHKQKRVYEREKQTLEVMLEEEQEENKELERKKAKKKLELEAKRREKKVKDLLFGCDEVSAEMQPYTDFHLKAEKGVQDLLQTRWSWDRYLVPVDSPHGSSVPLLWVSPAEPSSSQWTGFLSNTISSTPSTTAAATQIS